MRNKEFIGRPIPGKKEKRRETSPGTRTRNQKEPENHDRKQSSCWEKKKRKGGNKPRNPSWNKKEEGNHDGTQCHDTTEILRRYYGDKPHNPSWNQMEPGHDDGTERQKTTEMIPGTLPESKRTEEMMMEQNAGILGTKKTWWNKTVSWKSWEPHSPPELFGQQARNPSRNQERMMEQSARRVGRQAPQP